jgi:hypothetical protein
MEAQISTMARDAWGKHSDQDTLEAYHLGRLDGEPLVLLEEHLLVCERCRRALAEVADETEILQEALRRFPESREAGGNRTWLRAAGVVLVLLLPLGAYFATQLGGGKAAPAVVLAPYRSGEAPAVPEGKPELRVDLRGLAPASSYRAALVTEAGEPVWSGAMDAEGRFRPAVELRAGNYWVRVLDGGSELQLSEMALRVKPR